MRVQLYRGLQRITKISFLSAFLFFSLFPLYWITITSLKPVKDIFKTPIEYWPAKLSLENFIKLFEISKFHISIMNSLIVSITAAFFVLCITLLSAYVLARFNFKAKRYIFLAFLVTQMIPIFIALAPLYMLMSKLNLLNTLYSLLLIYTVKLIPFGTIILFGFLQQIPSSLEEAARIDGCSRLGALYRVVVPVMLPGIAATFIFAFVQCWDELFLAIMFIDKESAKTIPVALNSFILKYDIDWGSIAAATVLSVIPTMVLFSLFHKYLIHGLTSGAVKG